MGGATNKWGLTEKQDSFCRNYVETGNATEAYRRSYDTSNWKEKTINEQASRDLTKPKIIARVEALREANQKRNEVTIDSLTKDLKELLSIAKEDRQVPGGVNAVNSIAKLHGLLDKKEREELTERLADILERRK